MKSHVVMGPFLGGGNSIYKSLGWGLLSTPFSPQITTFMIHIRARGMGSESEIEERYGSSR